MPSLNLETSPSEAAADRPSWVARCKSALAGGTVLRAMLHGFMTVAGLTLLAKAVSFLKDAGVAHKYGISDELDSFNVAFGAFNFGASLLGGGLPGAMMPVYSKLLHQRGPWRGERLAFQSALVHFGSLMFLGSLFWVFSGPLVSLLCHGFPPAKQAVALRCIHGLLPFFVCYGMTLHLSNWLRGKMEFAVAAAAPVLTPLMMLAGIYTLDRSEAVFALIAGTNIGSAMTLLVLIWRLGHRLPSGRTWWRRSVKLWEPELRTVLFGAGPFVVAGILIGSAPLIDQAMATPLASGSVTALTYADKVCSIILALTATAAADTLFPFFSQVVARQDWLGLRRQLLHTTGVVLAFAVPMVVLLCWQAPLIVKLLFERGEFHAADTEHVAHVLRFTALQIPFYIASLLMSRVVVSMQANAFTLVVTGIALVNNVVFNRILMAQLGVAGIALSTAVVYFFSCVVLYGFLFRRISRLIKEQRIKEAAVS